MSLEPTKSIDELMQEAHAHVAGGRFKEAEEVLLDVIKRGDKKSSLQCFDALSVFAQNRGDFEDSIRFALRTIATNKELYGEESDQVVSSMVRLADIYDKAGKDEEANDLLYRAKMISDRLIFDESDSEAESQVGSAEQAEQFRSTLKYYAKEDATESQQDSGNAKPEDLEKDPDDLDFVFAEDEPREAKSGWLIDAIHKANARREQAESSQEPSLKPRAKGETTGPHKFLEEEPKGERRRGGGAVDAHDQSESRTNASTVRKDMLKTDSHMKKLVHSKEEIARSLDISNISWWLREFVKKRSNIMAVGIGACVFFVLLLVAAYFQPRKVTPLDAYVSMPHVYKSVSGDTRINLVREDAMQLQQGDTSMTIPTSYVVDWRSQLEVLVRSFFEKHYWLHKSAGTTSDTTTKTSGDSLIADDGSIYYTLHNPELLLGDQMQNITQDANAYYLDHSHYPAEATLHAYQNIVTRAAAKPKLKRSEFLASDADDVLRQIDHWKEEIANPREAPRPGVVDCFELLVSYPKGKMELFAVRSCKPKQKPQIVVSANGEQSENKFSPLIPEGGQFRPRRVWIETDDINPADAFCLHHASLFFSLLLSMAVAGSYAFLSLRGTLRRIRFNLLFVSLFMLAVYAAGTVLTF